MSHKCDAVLMISFGGPDKMEDVRPFLVRVTDGRNIPSARLELVVRNYELIGGRSPLKELTCRQAKALELVLHDRGHSVPVYVGMRNWHPLLSETVQEMSQNGATHAVGLIMSTHRCDAGWEQYQRNVADARTDAGVSLTVDYTEPVCDHPGFIEACAQRVDACLKEIPVEDRDATVLLFTAHSIPESMAASSRYEEQFVRSARKVAERVGHGKWQCGYQSRSGRPTDPWLAPDITEVIRELPKQGAKRVVLVPIGFVTDHVEVLYDLDIAAAAVSKEVGLIQHRAGTVIDHPAYISALADSVIEALQ